MPEVETCCHLKLMVMQVCEATGEGACSLGPLALRDFSLIVLRSLAVETRASMNLDVPYVVRWK